MVATQNLTVYQGSDYRQVLEFRDENSILMDVTGYTFKGQAKQKFSDASPAFSFSFTVRNQVTDLGIVDVLVADTETSVLSIVKATDYHYDIEMTDTSGDVRRILQGMIKVFPEVTK